MRGEGADEVSRRYGSPRCTFSFACPKEKGTKRKDPVCIVLPTPQPVQAKGRKLAPLGQVRPS